MLTYQPQYLTRILQEIGQFFPSSRDYALADDEMVVDILARIRNQTSSFAELSGTDLNFAYTLSKLCSEQEFQQLADVFFHRVTTDLFEIGWIYCQVNPNNERAVLLFSEACRHMKRINPNRYDQTLIGRAGLPWEDIYVRSIEMMRIARLSIEEFIDRFQLIPDTLFINQIQLTHLSVAGKDELLKHQELFARMITTADVELLRPAIRNYTAKVPYEEIPQLIGDAISYRLYEENADETLGLSPNLLLRVRRLRFSSLLSDAVNHNALKLNVYQSIAGMIRNIELLTASYFAVCFANYIVLENTEWKNFAYAYTPKLYRSFYEVWQSENFREDFWPAANEQDIVQARDVVLGLRKSGVIKIAFDDFDLLYTKDLLTISRYQ